MIGLVHSQTGPFDIQLVAQADELRDAVAVSLLTEARSPDAPAGKMGGWAGDSYGDPEGDLFGSHLWLLRGRRANEDTLRAVEDLARQALQWMLDDQVAEEIEVVAERYTDSIVALSVSITQPLELPPKLVGIWEIALGV